MFTARGKRPLARLDGRPLLPASRLGKSERRMRDAVDDKVHPVIGGHRRHADLQLDRSLHRHLAPRQRLSRLPLADIVAPLHITPWGSASFEMRNWGTDAPTVTPCQVLMFHSE